MNRKAYVACKFNCFFETEGFLGIIGSRLHCKSGNTHRIRPRKGISHEGAVFDFEIFDRLFRRAVTYLPF